MEADSSAFVGAALFMAGFLVVFIFIIRSFNHVNPSASAPEINSRAKLISKTMQNQGPYATSVFYLTFELADNSRILFRVPISEYSIVLEGETGMLTYKTHTGTNEFISFQRDGASRIG